MSSSIPSLVRRPLRTYADLRLAAISLCAMVTASFLLLFAGLSSVHKVRSLEAAQASSVLSLQELNATLERCKESLSSGEKMLSRRKINRGSFREPAIALDALQQALPDDAWIDSFRLSSGDVELVVKVNSERSSVIVVDRMRDTAKFSEARVETTEVNRGDGVGAYSLRIKAKIDVPRDLDLRVSHHEPS